jgi:ElaB/YqjD/DUF883 family membrane-anchored ribosome-binding protein
MKEPNTMENQIQTSSNDMGTLAEAARALMAATADVAGEKVAKLASNSPPHWSAARKSMAAFARKRSIAPRVTDEAVHEHPYQAIGIAFGVGAIIGFLVSRRVP